MTLPVHPKPIGRCNAAFAPLLVSDMSCQQDLPAPLPARLRSEANAVALDSKHQGDEYGSKALESSDSKDISEDPTCDVESSAKAPTDEVPSLAEVAAKKDGSSPEPSVLSDRARFPERDSPPCENSLSSRSSCLILDERTRRAVNAVMRD